MRDADRVGAERASDLTGSAPGLAPSAASAHRCNVRCRTKGKATSIGCKSGPGNPRPWQRPSPQVTSSGRSGMRYAPSSHSPGATRAVVLHDARRAQRSRHVDWHCHFAFPPRMRTRKIARLRRRSDSPLMAPRHAATAAAKVSLDRDRWSEPCKLKR